jgi:hypothetical protein
VEILASRCRAGERIVTSRRFPGTGGEVGRRRGAESAGVARFRSVTAMPRGTMPVAVEMVGLTADGEAYVWGGERVARPWHPEQRWASLSAGDWGQCGVTTRGELFCWGRGSDDDVPRLIRHP